LATIFQATGDYLWAMETQQKAIAIREKVLGSDHPDLGVSYRNIASTYASLGQLDTAIAYNRRGLRILVAKLPPHHSDIAKAKTEGANFHRLLGDRFCVSHDYQKAIDAYAIAYSLDSLEGSYLDNTGMAYAKLGDFKQAKALLKRLELLQPDSCLSLRAWSLYYTLKNDPEKSLDNLEKAIQLGYNDWNWIKTEEALERIRNHPRYLKIIENEPSH
jgi:tetratricopeptide (TPR) repeat protein